jgi:predicted ATP-dependent endonuclease of OLD family
MRIASITIKNFRGFAAETTIRFDQLWTSLVGKNGTGKTSVLEAIRLATSFVGGKIRADDFFDDSKPIEITAEFDRHYLFKMNDFQKVPARKIKFEAKHRDRAASGQAFSAEFSLKHTVIPACYNSLSELSPPLPQTAYVVKRIAYDDDTKTYRYWVEKYSEFRELSSRLLDAYSDEGFEGLPLVFFFDKGRDRGLRPQGTLFKKIAEELNWRFFREYKSDEAVTQEYVQMWETFYEFVVSKVDNPKQSKIIQPLKTKVTTTLGNKLKHLEISLLDPGNPFSGSFFSLREKDKSVSLNNLGSGELMMVTYFLLRITSELSKESIIFLIDEPELHLHPQLQFRLFEEIKSSSYQHIISTHSEMFVDISEWRSIRRFTESEIFPTEEILRSELSIDASGTNKKLLSAHLDDIKTFCQDKTVFFRENNELLFAEKVLLVEGPNDKYGHIAAATKSGRNLAPATLMSCIGKNKIPYFEILCVAFGVDFFCVYDFDQGGDEEGRDELIKEYAGDSTRYFSYQTSFEKVIGKKKLNQILATISELASLPAEVDQCLTRILEWID